jgi:hypothetical protein
MDPVTGNPVINRKGGYFEIPFSRLGGLSASAWKHTASGQAEAAADAVGGWFMH